MLLAALGILTRLSAFDVFEEQANNRVFLKSSLRGEHLEPALVDPGEWADGKTKCELTDGE